LHKFPARFLILSETHVFLAFGPENSLMTPFDSADLPIFRLAPGQLTYSQLRASFLKAAHHRGARLHAYPHPLKGVENENLCTDVAVAGDPNAEKWIVVVSGTHGVEGYYGSICQTRFLLEQDVSPAAGVGILFIHLINPWGTSWKRRVNEDNMDLNRNYLDFDQPLPANPGYEAVHELFATDIRDAARRKARDLRWRQTVQEKGYAALMNIVEAGQYRHRDGLYYGGEKPSWSNFTLHNILKEHLPAHARQIISFDLHTGAGQFGHPMLMAIAEQDYPGIARAQSIYGPWLYTVITGTNNASDTGISAAATGYTSAAMVKLFSDRQFTQLVVECGTYDSQSVGQPALLADHFLHLHGDPASAEGKKIKQRLLDFFFPADPDWQALVQFRTRQILERAVRALRNDQ
jgi:hypothetical protein